MVLKRVVAYFIDVLLVTFAASMLASISYLNPQLEKYNKVYDEYIEFSESYLDNIKNNEAEDIAEYKTKLEDLNYRLSKNNLYGSAISIVLTVIYFVFFQKYNGGQTLGKKIMKIKLDNNLSLFKYLIRTLILHNVFINALRLILILMISKENYLFFNNILYIAELAIETTIIIMVVMREDNRGLHDLIVDSNVVKI